MERAIQVLGDIKDLSELLQGASIDKMRLQASGERLKLDLELTRACLEGTPAGSAKPFGRKIPWVKSRLTLSDIRDAAFEYAQSGSSQVSLLACDSIEKGYTLSVTSQEGLRLVMSLDTLRGAFEDVGEPVAAS